MATTSTTIQSFLQALLSIPDGKFSRVSDFIDSQISERRMSVKEATEWCRGVASNGNVLPFRPRSTTSERRSK